MANEQKLVARSQKVAFYGVKGAGNTYINKRITGATDFSISKNSKEYSRQYVDEAFEETDVVGYSPSIKYKIDQYSGNPVHEDIVDITNNELIGNDAIRPIIIVDFTRPIEGQNNTYEAMKRDFSVIPDGEGDGTDSYQYSGALKVKGNKIKGTATSTDNFDTITFTSIDIAVLKLVTFNVSDSISQVSNANISINNQTLITNENGIADIQLLAGTYSYTVSKTGYTNKTGSITVSTASIYKSETIVAA